MAPKRKYPARGYRPKKSRTRVERKTKFLIVTEGVLTEPQYFERLRPIVEQRYGVQLVSMPRTDKGNARGGNWKSDPLHVVKKCVEKRDEEAARSRKSKRDVPEFTRCFAVVDVDGRDVGKSPTVLQQAISLAADEGISLIVSNHKFEVWLIWHHDKASPSSAAERLTPQATELGFVEGKNISTEFPIENFLDACQRAKKAALVSPGSVGSNPSTAMPSLFDAIMQAQKNAN